MPMDFSNKNRHPIPITHLELFDANPSPDEVWIDILAPGPYALRLLGEDEAGESNRAGDEALVFRLGGRAFRLVPRSCDSAS
jgi:hypothetical protein